MAKSEQTQNGTLLELQQKGSNNSQAMLVYYRQTRTENTKVRKEI